jgi:hypothetical protein
MTASKPCRRCGDLTKNQKGFCSWCKQIKEAIEEVHEIDEWYELTDGIGNGYQPLGPEGGRIFTRNGDPGNPQ